MVFREQLLRHGSAQHSHTAFLQCVLVVDGAARPNGEVPQVEIVLVYSDGKEFSAVVVTIDIQSAELDFRADGRDGGKLLANHLDVALAEADEASGGLPWRRDFSLPTPHHDDVFSNLGHIVALSFAEAIAETT